MRNIGKYVVGAVLCYLCFSFLGCSKDSYHFNDVAASVGDTTTLLGVYNTERGDSAYNSVFLHLSTNTQTTVLRTAWDLGLYSGADNKVIINHSTGATVIDAGKTDWLDNSLTVDQDSTRSPTNIATLLLNNSDGLTSAPLTAVDPVVGNSTTYLSGTVIKLGEVYILNRGTMTNLGKRKWMKIKVTAITNGYNVEYGALSDPVSNTVQVVKNASYNFNYISFSSSTVTVEPGSAYWDLEYTTTTYLNPADNTKPIGTTDFMMINFMGGVTAAQVNATSTLSYANCKLQDTAGVTFLGTRDIIGTNWRAIVPNSPSYININNNYFYMIKDKTGNIYKVSFAGGGSRGKPIIEYTLLNHITVIHPVR